MISKSFTSISKKMKSTLKEAIKSISKTTWFERKESLCKKAKRGDQKMEKLLSQIHRINDMYYTS